MTDKTTTQNLTRTTSTDEPIRTAEYLGILAREVDQRMRAHRYDLGRSQTPPLAVVRRAVVGQFDTAAEPRVSFDTVLVDTAGLVDLAVSEYMINLRQTGWWCIGGYLQCTGFGAANADVTIEVAAAGGNAYNSVRDNLVGIAALSTSLLVQVSTPDTQTASLDINYAGSSTSAATTLQLAELWAYKVRDL